MPREDYEVIIVDDCSYEPLTIEVLQDFEKKDETLNIIWLEENNGTPSVGRNEGLEEASGEYVYILDSDDYIAVSALEYAYSALSSQNLDVLNVPMYQGPYPLEDMNIDVGGSIAFEVYAADKFPFARFTGQQFIRRELIEEYELWYDEELSYCEDLLFSTSVNIYADRIGELFEYQFIKRNVNPNIDLDGRFAPHLGSLRKNTEIEAISRIADFICNADVDDQRACWFLLNSWGTSNIFANNKPLKLIEVKKDGGKKLMKEIYSVFSMIPEELIELLPSKTVEAIENKDAEAWVFSLADVEEEYVARNERAAPGIWG